jgi:hypothetical protein
MALVSLLLCCCFCSAQQQQQQQHGEEKEYGACILGAGGSGMQTAWRLKDKGVSVLLLERSGVYGGHCQSAYYTKPDGTRGVIETGVALFPDTGAINGMGYGPWKFSMREVVERFAGANRTAPTPFVGLATYACNLRTGESYGPVGGDFGELAVALASALQRLLNITAHEFPWIDTLVDVPPQIPAELLLPLDAWLAHRGLDVLQLLFANSIAYGGYGPLSEITALAALAQAGNPTNLMFTLSPGSWFTISSGCTSMYDGIADYVGRENILTDVFVERVLRRGGARVHYRRGGGRAVEVVRCGKVIVAHNPTPQGLLAFDLTPQERALFRGVAAYQVTVATANVTGPAVDGVKFAVASSDPANPALGFPALPALVNLYRYNVDGPAIAMGEASLDNVPQTVLEAVMRSESASYPPSLVTSVDFIEFYPHFYNPVFPVASLAGSRNAFLRLDDLQGSLDTVWVGALRTTGNTAYISNYIVALMERGVL